MADIPGFRFVGFAGAPLPSYDGQCGFFGSRLNPMAVTSIGFINEYVAHPASKSRTIFAY